MRFGQSKARIRSCRKNGFPDLSCVLGLLILLSLSSGCLGYIPKVTLDQSDGDIAFVSNQQKREPGGWLYLINTENKRWSRPLGTAYSVPDPMSWSPDGTQIAFVGVLVEGLDRSDYGYGGEGVMILDAKGHSTIFSPCCFSPAWSPDGQYLAFHKDCGHGASLNIGRIDRSGERELVTGLIRRITPDNKVQHIRISWSPDGRYLAYDNPDASGIWSIWIVDQEGNATRRLTLGRNPAWSPLGDEIAFDRDGEIWTISVGDGTEKRLMTLPIHAEWPTWSPDGRRLVFVGGQGADIDIYLVNRDGRGLKNLTNRSGWDLYPAWRPRPSTSQ